MKILQTILPALAMCAMLASCTKSPMEGYVPQPGEIYFGSRGITVETKSVTETTGDVLQSGGFVCAAVIDAGNSVMFNTALSYADGYYKVPGKKYFFPSEGTVSFYAAYPVSEQISVANDGTATLSYSQNDSEDLVVATSPRLGSRDDAVTLSFSHVLSQLLVKCRGNDPETDFYVKNISVTAPAGAVYDYGTDSWTSVQDAQDYRFVPSEGEDVGQDYSKSMTFIPGKVQVSFAWECRIKGTQTVVGEYEQSVTLNLVKGRRTTMNVTLCNSEADELSFTASVDAWEGEEVDIDMEEFRILETLKQEAAAAIDALVGVNKDPNVLAEAEQAKEAINAANSAAEVEKMKQYGLEDIRCAMGSYPSVYLGMIDSFTGERVADQYHYTTANCYILRQRAWYFIPLIYGNGVVNGTRNQEAYTGDAFTDHEGNPITTPYILSQLKLNEIQITAELLWESQKDLLGYVGISSGELCVQLKRKDVKGNAVVAVKKKTDGSIIWSWHIWVLGRDADLKLLGYNGTQMLNLDLGASGTDQNGHLYYQWGRKDPFMATPKRTMTGGGKPGSLTIRDAISNPEAFFTTSEENQLWFNNEYSSGKELCSKIWNPVKTIYDPCPVGFCVPGPAGFNDFGTRLSSSQSGKTVLTINDDNSNAGMFRAGGYIGSNGVFHDASPAISCYWTNVPGSSGSGQHGTGSNLSISQAGSAAMTVTNASIGGTIRPMKINN